MPRYYDPTTGQFLTVDPLNALTGQPYSYANGNPINATDPLGLDGGFFGTGIGPNVGPDVLPTPGQAWGRVKSVAGAVASGVSSAATWTWNNRGTVAESAALAFCLSTPADGIGATACPYATAGGFAIATEQTWAEPCLSTGQRIGGTLLDGLATVPGLQDTFIPEGGKPLKWLSGTVGGAGVAANGPIVANSPR